MANRVDIFLVKFVLESMFDVLDVLLYVSDGRQLHAGDHDRLAPLVELHLAEVLVRHKLQPVDTLCRPVPGHRKKFSGSDVDYLAFVQLFGTVIQRKN